MFFLTLVALQEADAPIILLAGLLLSSPQGSAFFVAFFALLGHHTRRVRIRMKTIDPGGMVKRHSSLLCFFLKDRSKLR